MSVRVSLADELYLIQAMFLCGEHFHLQFISNERAGPLTGFMANNNWVGLYGFTRVSQILSAIIASERCPCVLSPPRFQTLLQTRTMAAVIRLTYLLVIGLFFIVATRYRIACIFDPATDTVRYTSVASEFDKNHRKFISDLDSFVYGAGIPGIVITVATTTTVITAMKIGEAALW